jgi:hypothetical protein
MQIIPYILKQTHRGGVCLLGAVMLAASPLTGAGAETPKSDLVRSLEGIFYAADFAPIPDRQFRVNDYGARGDGETFDTEAIQKTIDAAHTAGGGVVVFDPGTYLTGALFVKSHVELHLGEEVVLEAIQDNSHYPQLPTRIAGVEMKWPAAVINVYEQENVRITGKGLIDGKGPYWWHMFWAMIREYEARGLRWAVDFDCERVRPVVVWKSSDVLLRDFRIHDSGFWSITLTYSDRVHVDGIVVRANISGRGPSSDGINTDSSSNILVENCDVDCNDDNYTLKAGKDADGLRVNRPTENVVYRNSIARRGYGMFTLGSETAGGMRNIEVYGMRAVATRAGIRFKSARVRGGVMENIYFHNIEMERVSTAFEFNLNWFPSYSYPTLPDNIPEEEITDRWRRLIERVEPPERGIPEFRDIRFANIRARNSHTAIQANAYPEKPMRNFHWENVHIHASQGGRISHAKDWTMTHVTLDANSQVSVEHSENVELPQMREPMTRFNTLPKGGFRIEAEWMDGPWRLHSDKYAGFDGDAYAASPYALQAPDPEPMEGRLEIPFAGRFTVYVRALKGGAHQDRALQVEVAGNRLEPTHTGQGPEGGFSWEWQKAGTVDLPAGIVEFRIHPVGRTFPTADAIVFDAH